MRSQTVTQTVGAASQVVLPANPNRVSLIFSGDGTNTFTVSQQTPVVAGQGLVFTATVPAIQVDSYELGDNITGPWYGICSAAGGKLTIIEGFV